MAPSPTKTSTPRLSEAARHVVIPDGVVTTGWPAVRAKAAELNIARYDAWQDGLGRIMLGKRGDGKYAATVGGVVLSIGRQVGKTFTIGSLLVVMCILFPGYRAIWTAHRQRTTTNTFRTLQGICARKLVRPHVAYIRTANGEQEIGFRNGSVILFGAREQGFGRGFDVIDALVFDEAQILTEKALEDMVAATNQARHPHGALLFFLGTPPRPVDPGEAFSLKRANALSGKSRDTVYVEFSADEDAGPDDREQWARANPSYPHRTPLESMLRLRENLPSEDSWLREALGVWHAEGSDAVIGAEAWAALADEQSLAVEELSLGIDVAPDRLTSSVALAGRRADGLWHVELVESRRGTGWIAPYVAERVAKNKIRAVVVDALSPAASLLDDLTEHKVRVTVTNSRDMAAACGRLYDAAMDDRLRHIDQPQLNYSLSQGRRRPLGDAWGWNRKAAESDITPIVAVTLALHGAQSSNVERPRGRAGSGKVVVMS